MGLASPEGRVDSGVRVRSGESEREQHKQRPEGRNVITGMQGPAGRRD